MHCVSTEIQIVGSLSAKLYDSREIEHIIILRHIVSKISIFNNQWISTYADLVIFECASIDYITIQACT